jgi:hypothetical protein
MTTCYAGTTKTSHTYGGDNGARRATVTIITHGGDKGILRTMETIITYGGDNGNLGTMETISRMEIMGLRGSWKQLWWR